MRIRVPLLAVAALIALPAAGNDETVTFQVEVDLGKDRGQSFGSVFEARNASDRVVAGAGFQDVYNTRFRSDRHTLQFFVRPDSHDRFSVTRLAHPDLTDASVHPYETEAQKYGLVTNHWGQRVTSLIPLGDSVFVSTSAKGTYPWEDRYTFLTDGQRREYGAVLRLRMPGNLAAQIEWKERPIQLTFLVSPDRLTILQDGKELATTALERGFPVHFSGLSVTWGQGVFGPLRGELISRECSVK